MVNVTTSVKPSEVHTDVRVERDVWRLLAEVPDPEIPVLNVVELGLIRYVRGADARVEIGVSPTYTGCPATEVIQAAIRSSLQAAGYSEIRIDTVLSPPWTSDWLTDGAREKLKDYGIAPPAHAVSNLRHVFREPKVHCPRCESRQTRRVSEFASTLARRCIGVRRVSSRSSISSAFEEKK